MHNKIIKKIENYNNIAILGFGKEGISTYNFIRRYNKNIKLTILDMKEVNLEDNNTFYKKYTGLLEELLEFDLIIKTPGISFKDINIEKIKDRITSQMELLLEVNHKNMIGITGTKGKSTTSSLIYKILKEQGKKTFLVGNIGIPVLDNIEDYKDAIIVAEMSSHQLEFVKHSPHIGIILNLFEDHLDHAGSVKHYHECKMNMIKYLNKEDYGIIDIDNDYLIENLENYDMSNILTVSNEKEADIYEKDGFIYLDNIKLTNKENLLVTLKGDHNLKNIMFVLLVSKLYNLDFKLAFESIKKFEPLEHRMELVGTYNDITFYNDSIATIPEATINAIITLKNVDTLIFGGMDRKIDYSKLIEYLNNSKVKHFICMPTTGYEIAKYLDQNKVYKIETLKEAVELSFELTSKNSICLLSPAAPSYEQFKNFEEKGLKYKEYIKEFDKKNI